MVVQEDNLAKWCLLQVGLGHPATPAQIKALGWRIASESDDEQPLGGEWCRSFLQHHPGLKIQRARQVDSIWLSCTRETFIQPEPSYDHFQIPGIKEIKQENHYNKDKADIIEGRGTNALVVGTSDNKAV